MPQSTTQAPSKWNDLGRTSASLAFWKALIVSGTQPGQVVMRYQQRELASGRVLNAPSALGEIIKHSPRTGFIPTNLFRGSLSAMGKEAFKNRTYKAIAFKGAPKLVKQYTPFSIGSNLSPMSQHLLISFLAAEVASTADTVFLGGYLNATPPTSPPLKAPIPTPAFSKKYNQKEHSKIKWPFCTKDPAPLLLRPA